MDKLIGNQEDQDSDPDILPVALNLSCTETSQEMLVTPISGFFWRQNRLEFCVSRLQILVFFKETLKVILI